MWLPCLISSLASDHQLRPLPREALHRKPKCLRTWQLALPRVRDLKELARKRTSLIETADFYNLIRSDSQSLLSVLLIAQINTGKMWEESLQGLSTGRQALVGGVGEAGYHK